MSETYDVIVIGGGVVGCMTARFLSRYQLRILLIDKETDVGMGASSANSAIVHAGYDPLPGTLKAKMNVLGNPMWDNLAGELNFPFERRGDYVVAIGAEELPGLEKLLEQGRRNGVPGMHLISARRDAAARAEHQPAVQRRAVGAHRRASATRSPSPSPPRKTPSRTGWRFSPIPLSKTSFWKERRSAGCTPTAATFACRWAVNAAGLYSDEVMHRAGVRPEFKITPRRGEYCVLDRAEITINNVLFPTPSSAGKGILVTTTLHGNTIAGPNAEPAGG